MIFLLKKLSEYLFQHWVPAQQVVFVCTIPRWANNFTKAGSGPVLPVGMLEVYWLLQLANIVKPAFPYLCQPEAIKANARHARAHNAICCANDCMFLYSLSWLRSRDLCVIRVITIRHLVEISRYSMCYLIWSLFQMNGSQINDTWMTC